MDLPEALRTVLVPLVVSAVAAGVGAYIGAYLKKRGEQKAIEKDFQDIKRQLQETTKITEVIKTQVTGEYWLAQEKWKLKRDLYLDLLHNLAAMIDSIYRLEISKDAEELKRFPEKMDQVNMELKKAKASAQLVSDDGARIIADLEADLAKTNAKDIGEVIRKVVPLFQQAYKRLAAASKKDLRLDV